MRRGGSASASRVSDHRAPRNFLSDFDCEGGKVGIVCCNAAAVLHYNHIAIAVVPPGILNYTAQACTDWIPQSCFYVKACMEARPSSERIAAISKTAPYLGRGRNCVVFLKLGARFSIHRRNGN